jgi:hypothetical protein
MINFLNKAPSVTGPGLLLSTGGTGWIFDFGGGMNPAPRWAGVTSLSSYVPANEFVLDKPSRHPSLYVQELSE